MSDSDPSGSSAGLDSLGSSASLDSLGVADTARRLPAALAATLDAAASAGVPSDLEVGAVVLAASARSRLAALAVESVGAARVGRPVVVSVDAPLPSWVGPGTLVIALDGVVAQRLLDDSTVDGVPIIAVGAPDPSVRPEPILEAAAGLAALDAFGLAPGLIDDMLHAVPVLQARLDGELGADRPPASRLARRIGRTMPLVYGGGPVGAGAAVSWKHSVNRNAKAPAFAGAVPGIDHDEVCGWAQHGDVTRQVFTLAVLRHAFETPDQAHRLDVTAETCDEVVAGVYQVRSEASSPAAALLDLMLQGELVSLAMADQADIDPGPTPVTDRYL